MTLSSGTVRGSSFNVTQFKHNKPRPIQTLLTIPKRESRPDPRAGVELENGQLRLERPRPGLTENLSRFDSPLAASPALCFASGLLIALAWVLLDASRIRFAFSGKPKTKAIAAAILALGLGLAAPAKLKYPIRTLSPPCMTA